jgi:hypothetical protein
MLPEPLLQVHLGVLCTATPIFRLTANGATMGSAMGWFTTIVLLIMLVLVFHQLGVNITGTIGQTLRGVEHFLGEPVFVA